MNNFKGGININTFHTHLLSCQTKQISWVRRSPDDIHILSHNSIMFTTDPRYSVHFYPLSGIWELRLGMLRMGDTGVYECQVLYCTVL